MEQFLLNLRTVGISLGDDLVEKSKAIPEQYAPYLRQLIQTIISQMDKKSTVELWDIMDQFSSSAAVEQFSEIREVCEFAATRLMGRLLVDKIGFFLRKGWDEIEGGCLYGEGFEDTARLEEILLSPGLIRSLRHGNTSASASARPRVSSRASLCSELPSAYALPLRKACAAVIAPMRPFGFPMGFLLLGERMNGLPFKDSDLLTASMIANVTGGTLERYRRRWEQGLDLRLECFTQRYGLKKADEEKEAALVKQIPVAFFLAGADKKDFSMDILLSLLRKELDQGCGVCRYGKKDFFLWAPGQDLLEGMKTAEKIRRSVVLKKELPGTISMGITEWGGAEDSMEKVLKRVQKSRDDCRKKGGNRVMTSLF